MKITRRILRYGESGGQLNHHRWVLPRLEGTFYDTFQILAMIKR